MGSINAPSPADRTSERALRFERALVRIRWFGIAFGAFQVAFYNPYPGTVVPRSMAVISGIALALLLAANVIVSVTLRRDSDARVLARVGAIAFAIDLAAMWSLVWAFTFEEYGATWVILSFGVMEGALRYQLRGALLPVMIALPLEPLRDLYRVRAFDFTFYLDSLTFRLGFLAIIGSFTGVIARNLDRERAHAVARAADLAELAEREHEARAESNAFQQVILAGVAAQGMQDALQRMIDHTAEQLGYEHIAVLMVDRDALSVVALSGFSPETRHASVPLGEGIAGHVAITGITEIISDVALDPRYYAAEPSTRSQVTVPINVADHVIGVLDCESPELNAFDEVDAGRLERLAAQMALVIENARLLSKERAMVERLRELDQMRSDFIAIASHELRTPLTAIQGSIKTLRRRDITIDPDDLHEFLAVLDRQSDRLTRLVEDLLMVSHIDAGGVSLKMGSVDLADAMEDVLAEIGARARRVSIAVPPAMPALHTDGHRLRQIARNLVDNALKFSADPASVRVTAHRDARRLVLEVADEGHGISEEDRQRIFERFYQVGGSLRRRGDGFGLGLYITKRLVEALGGTIDVDSTVGRGTTFRVVLPAVGTDGSAGSAYAISPGDAGASGVEGLSPGS